MKITFNGSGSELSMNDITTLKKLLDEFFDTDLTVDIENKERLVVSFKSDDEWV